MKTSRDRNLLALFLISSSILLCAFIAPDAGQDRQEKSWEAFERASSVLRSPRCLNCHARGNSPTQGDLMEPHNMGTLRGVDGRGVAPMRCVTCHQNQNSPTLNAPPGTDDWHMPSQTTPLVWQGLSTSDLCTLLTDPSRNGGRSGSQVIDHLDTGLVKWAWQPGPGRSAPPLSYQAFLTLMKEWQDNGASCGTAR